MHFGFNKRYCQLPHCLPLMRQNDYNQDANLRKLFLSSSCVCDLTQSEIWHWGCTGYKHGIAPEVMKGFYPLKRCRISTNDPDKLLQWTASIRGNKTTQEDGLQQKRSTRSWSWMNYMSNKKRLSIAKLEMRKKGNERIFQVRYTNASG